MNAWSRRDWVLAAAWGVAAATAMVGIACQGGGRGSAPSMTGSGSAHSTPDEEASRAAFIRAYAVLSHPRCVNCHPQGDAPLQGEDSRPHAQNVKRGPDGKGLYALKCANCHQSQNVPGLNMPPGNPNWHLPPENMKMVFEGLSPAELAAQLKDPARNGHKSLDEILKHVREDSLVLGGWNPGEGRSKPPLSHEEFVAAMREWIDRGAAIPK